MDLVLLSFIDLQENSPTYLVFAYQVIYELLACKHKIELNGPIWEHIVISNYVVPIFAETREMGVKLVSST